MSAICKQCGTYTDDDDYCSNVCRLNHELFKTQEQRDNLLGTMKNAVVRLNHLVPTIDPQMDGSDIYQLCDAVIARANHVRDGLIGAIALYEKPSK